MSKKVVKKKSEKELANEKSERILNGVAAWAGFYRANPHRFVVDYLNTKLKDAVAKGNTHCVISELTMVAMLTKKYSLPAEDCYKQWIQQFISLLIYTYGYRCEYQQESTDNKIILFF